MKENYLSELRLLLDNYQINQEEKDDIIADYGTMIDDALNKKLTEKRILRLIGTPKEVINSLAEEFEKEEDYIYIHHGGKRKSTANTIIGIIPIISLIVFFVLGIGFNLWHPGWLVFLSIPMVAVIVNACDRNSLNGFIAISPFIAIIGFIVVGFVWDLWHPGWLIFLLVPILAILSSFKTMRFKSFLTSITPFISTIVFVMVGYFTGLWNPLWLVFLSIPMTGVLHERKVWKIILFEMGFIISIVGYLYIGYVYQVFGYALFAFMLPILISLIFSEDSFFEISKRNREEWVLFLLLLIIYIIFGVFYNSWLYLWMIFVLVPIFAIMRKTPKDIQLIALMPFISLILFFSFGYFFGWWAYSWIAFVFVPIVAIIKNKK